MSSLEKHHREWAEKFAAGGFTGTAAAVRWMAEQEAAQARKAAGK